ncbi:acyl-CoA thioesterase [Salinarimonas chemoclinalis]|uniref:acyl-CoA thioesterase n=1 Tax=Salinarimonas chemoclinalis TaxID=3241599 RepID=UPI0035590DBA
MSRQPRPARDAFAVFRPIQTRWMDNDVYGHVNNVVYYSYFDTAVNGWYVDEGLLDVAASPVIGLVVETSCAYFESVAFPEGLEAGITVARLGTSSVTYAVGIFKAGAPAAAAAGRFTHVFVSRENSRPVPIPPEIRAALERLPITALPSTA